MQLVELLLQHCPSLTHLDLQVTGQKEGRVLRRMEFHQYHYLLAVVGGAVVHIELGLGAPEVGAVHSNSLGCQSLLLSVMVLT
jgi:hypothetical protein